MSAGARLLDHLAKRIPGTAEHATVSLAREKRQLERQLRAAGMGRGQAKAEVARRFRADHGE